MKRSIGFVCVVVGITVLAASAAAQVHGTHQAAREAGFVGDAARHAGGMMGGGMMMEGGMEHGGGQGAGMMDRHRGPMFYINHAEALGLTGGQVETLKEMQLAHHTDMIGRDASLRGAELELAALLDAGTVDLGAVEKKVRATEKIRGDLRIAVLTCAEKAKAVLTDEQRAAAKDIKPAHGEGPMMGGDGRGAMDMMHGGATMNHD